MELNSNYLAYPRLCLREKFSCITTSGPPSAASAQSDFAFGLRPIGPLRKVPMRMGTGVARALSHDARRGLPVGLRWLPSVIIALTWNIPRP